MNNQINRALSALAIVAISLIAFGTFTFSQSYAQSSTDDSRSSSFGKRIRNMAQNFGRSHFGPGHGGRGHGGRGHDKGLGHSAEAVAEALGITIDELKAAREEGKSVADLQGELGIDAETFQANLKAAAIAEINQKVADGDITQEKADAWIAKIESSDFSMDGRGHGKGHGKSHGKGHSKGMGDRSGVVAEALGITVDELKAAREEGKSLADLQEDLGIDAETFQANLKAATIAQINQKLADGDITQEKADAWIEKIESSEFNMSGRGSGKGHGNSNGHGRGQGKAMAHKANPVAEALGITVDELKAAREEGKSVADLQEELGIDAETFQANLKAATIAQINQKVADGDITQEKADAWIEKIESSEFNMGERGFGKGNGKGHGKGHRNHDKDAADDVEESGSEEDADDDGEQSAEADGASDGDALFRVLNPEQIGEMSLFLPTFTAGTN